MKRKNVESLLMAAALAMAAPSVLPATGEVVQAVAETAEEALEASAVEVSAATLDGWVKQGKYTYYYKDGKALKGLRTIGGKKYYFDKSGRMQVSKMVSTGGVRYYFTSNGQMYTGKPKFISYKGAFYWVDSSHKATIRPKWQTINGHRYFLSNNGVPYKGYRKIGKCYYYFDPQGRMQKNTIVTANGKQYYIKSDGKRYGKNNVFVKVDGKYYWVNSDYSVSVKSRWQTINGELRFLNNDGSPAKGYRNIGGYYYYLDKLGRPQKNRMIDYRGTLYYFCSDGKQYTGPSKFISDNRKWYWMDGSTHKAVLANGLHDVRGKLLYLDDGVAQKGFIFVNGYNYHFNDKDGAADKGWVTNGKDKYYYDLKTCQGYIGWKTVEGKERYFYDDSKMAVNTTIDGKEIGPDGTIVSLSLIHI